MTSIFDKLNLRPQERRLVMVAMVVTFVVLNLWLVLPHFNEWRQMLARLAEARNKAVRFDAEIKKTEEYKKQLATLQSEASYVVADQRDLALVETINTEAAKARVSLQRVTPMGGGPIPDNPFFEEQRVAVNGIATDEELVNFLKALGSGNSLIRVRDLDLKVDASGQKLLATLTIVGNYQKKPVERPVVPPRGGAAQNDTRSTATPKKK
jgi:hypothetical protein